MLDDLNALLTRAPDKKVHHIVQRQSPDPLEMLDAPNQSLTAKSRLPCLTCATGDVNTSKRNLQLRSKPTI